MSNSFEQQVQDQFTERHTIYDRRSSWIMNPGILDMILAASRVAVAAADTELLDVCCGTGAVGGAFKGRVRRRVGLDLTQAMLDVASSRLDEVVQGNALDMPFNAERFDLVVSRQALHFFDDPAMVIAEMYRVARPGGQIILAQRVPYGDADTEWMAELNRLKQPNLKTFMLERHLTDGIEKAGFKDLAVTNFGVWESINDWVESPEVSLPNRGRILEHCKTAPARVRAVHPIVVDGDQVRACWRWVFVSAHKP
jgi:DNA gyrase subunit B